MLSHGLVDRTNLESKKFKMKKLLLILLIVGSLSCSAQVVISAPTARYFLEMEERARLLDSLVVIKQQTIGELNNKIDLIEAREKTYKQDVESLKSLLALSDKRLSLKDAELEYADKEIKRQYRQKLMLAGTTTGALIGSAVGQPWAGAAIGAGAGYVGSLFKKKLFKKPPRE